MDQPLERRVRREAEVDGVVLTAEVVRVPGSPGRMTADPYWSEEPRPDHYVVEDLRWDGRVLTDADVVALGLDFARIDRAFRPEE